MDKKIPASRAKKFVSQTQQKLDSARKHEDGWVNVLNGIGNPLQDKRLQSFFQRGAVNWDSAEDMWRADDMAARVVECLPDEMLREGFELNVQDELDDSGDERADSFNDVSAHAADKPDAGGGGRPGMGAQKPAKTPDDSEPVQVDKDSKAIAEAMMTAYESLNADEKIRMALYWSRAYGGGAILVGADDGELDWSKPLNEDNIKSIKYLNALEPRELLPLYYYGDPRASNYGEPMIYQLNRIMIAGEIPQNQAYLRIHESRIIRFDGIRVGRRQIIANAGWGDSIYTRIIQTIQDFQNVWQGAALILSDFAQAILKIKGLAEMVAKNGKDKVLARAQAISASRSIAGMVLIDSEEEFSRTPTPITGFPEMLDRFCNRLAAAARTPVTILMGQAPSGLNATGQSDLEWYSNQVAAEQKRSLNPQRRRLFTLLFKNKSGPTRGIIPTNWSIKNNALKQLSDVERATIRLQTAQADASDIQNDVLLPAEVAKSRYGGDKYSTDTHVDLSLREKTRQAIQEPDGQEGINDEYHTGRGEPGSSPTPSNQMLEAGDNVVGAGANGDPALLKKGKNNE